MLALLAAAASAPSLPSSAVARTAPPRFADEIRAVEHQRLEAMVKGDVAAAARFHAEDFELVGPVGTIDHKDDELRSVTNGFYVALQPGPIEVEQTGADGALIRYQVAAVLKIGGKNSPERHFWHMDYYERRHGQWQVVWSQSTEIPPPRTPAAPRTPG